MNGLTVGTTLSNRYRIEEVLGRGGMATVYRARDTQRDTEVALKIASEEELESEEGRLRFHREFYTLQELQHPNVVRVFDFGSHEDRPFYTLEPLDPLPLDEQDRMSPGLAFRVMRDVAAALAMLHARGLIHRDISRNNVRVDSEGRAKLIDFGTLATAGIAGTVIGTPPYLAPETWRGGVVDHRTDLYALGALTFRLLCGEAAYPVRKFEDLEAVWRSTKPSLKARGCTLDPALAELVESLISLDPLERPASAAALIDRVSALIELPPLETERIAMSSVHSAALVGRQQEVGLLRTCVDDAAANRSCAVVLEGPHGIGKSRLLRELHLEARLAGAQVVDIGAAETPGRGPLTVLRAVAAALIDAIPETVRKAARPDAALLVRAVPALQALVGVPAAEPTGDPVEDRFAQHNALVNWLLDLSRSTFLAILIDDIQDADEASTAVFADTARRMSADKLLLGFARRVDEHDRPAGSIEALRELSLVLTPKPFSLGEIEALVTTFFGNVAHLQKLASWLAEVAVGNPLYCLEVIQHLVRSEGIVYSGGHWELPSDFRDVAGPSQLHGYVQRRIETLTPRARRFAELIAVHGDRLSLGQVSRLTRAETPAELIGTLNELVGADVLRTSAAQYWIGHRGLTEAIVGGMDAEGLRDAHGRVADALLSQGAPTEENEAAVGWHLYQSGRREEASVHLDRAGRRLFEQQSHADCIPLLEAALELYEGQGHLRAHCLEIKRLLLTAGSIADRDAALRYAQPVVDELARLSGLDTAQRLRRLGRKPAFMLGLARAGLRRLFTPAAQRGPGPIEAIQLLSVAVGSAAGTFSATSDVQRLRALLPVTEPFTAFRGEIPEAAYLFVRALVGVSLGRWPDVESCAERVLHILEQDKKTPISDHDREQGKAGAHNLLCAARWGLYGVAFGPAFEELARSPMRLYQISTELFRLTIHRALGEEHIAQEHERNIETLSVQLGASWLVDVQIPFISTLAYSAIGDALGLRRCIADLRRMVADGLSVQDMLHSAEGYYHLERGEYEQAEEAFLKVRDTVASEQGETHSTASMGLASTYLATGRLAEARQEAEFAYRISKEGDYRNILGVARALTPLALVCVAEGNAEAGAQIMDRELPGIPESSGAAHYGAAHETRARVAWAMGDPKGFEEHLKLAERCYRPTKNSVLISRVARLRKIVEAVAVKDEQRAEHVIADAVTARYELHSQAEVVTLPEAEGYAVFVAAIDRLRDATGAAAGLLFVPDGDGLKLVCARGVAGAPPGMDASLLRLSASAASARAEGESDSISQGTVEVSSAAAAGAHFWNEWLPIWLREDRDPGSPLVAAAVVREGRRSLRPPDPGLILGLARALAQAGTRT